MLAGSTSAWVDYSQYELLGWFDAKFVYATSDSHVETHP